MKVLFIGGTGNISRSVSLGCVARGMDLHLLTRGTRDVTIPGARVMRADINATNDIQPLLEAHHWDAVVDWIAFTPEDIERDIGLFQGRTNQFVFISSASVYQKPPAHPVITESTPLLNPFWEYSRRKIACEERLNRAYRDDGFPITIVRPSHTYDTVIPLSIGGWTEYTPIERIRKGQPLIVHGDGTSLWTVTHSEDFAKGFIGLLGHPRAIGEAFHITSDEILTWNQIYQTVAAAAGHEAHLIHIPSDFIAACEESFRGGLLGDKAHSVIFDNSKIKRVVPEFQATIPFHVGIKRTLAWFEADPARQIVKQETNEWMDRIIAAYRQKDVRI
ncbi:MAG: NAD-dependent epimerase/dehydratase [Bacteroidetes bacterium]|nr:NAD-dependent epimerase/dehydratase [Bacteroidota bacterium]